ncbi:MAG: hypothetical protein P4L59_17185, partial [Desulfosporosinus sp.]|nr:hypothetical protein [Desulfosporosinus sp.]
LVHCPVFGVGRLNGSLLGCLRKDVALCRTASRAWVGERTVGRTAHFMCTVCLHASQGRFLAGEGTVLGCISMQLRTVPICVLGCLRKDVALYHTASRAGDVGQTFCGDGTFHVHRLKLSGRRGGSWLHSMQPRTVPICVLRTN